MVFIETAKFPAANPYIVEEKHFEILSNSFKDTVILKECFSYVYDSIDIPGALNCFIFVLVASDGESLI